MGRYFGTDGVRGVANKELTPELAFKLGRISGYYIKQENSQRALVVIGKDTRLSGDMLEGALVSGLLSSGVDVVRLGVISTPGVAYLTREFHADAGIMISASHNPVEDNGIKFFNKDGFKLSDKKEEEIEAYIDVKDSLPRPVGEEVGRVIDRLDGKEKYIDYLKRTVSHRFSGLKIVLDTANGAAYNIAPDLFTQLGAEVVTIFSKPDGTNINKSCGSTHPEALVEKVLETKADLGLAYDGDADRLIAVDEKGQIVDGDQIMFVCGSSLNKKGLLKKNTIVTTVMSNIGLYKAFEQDGLKSLQTKVGDKYVMEEMLNKGLNLGGEQSGHIIFLDYNTTGDGILTSIQLVNIIQDEKQTLSALAGQMKKYPQLLENVRVQDKSKYNNNVVINDAIKQVENKLGDEGRVLIRPSGTENLIRVMAEGPDEDLLKEYVNYLTVIVKQELS